MALDRSHRFRMLVLGAACAVAATPNSLLGQTWDGGGGDNHWTIGFNWNTNSAPANNGTANIIFGGTTRLTPFVDVAQDIQSLTFDNTAGAFTIGGGALTIRAGGITNNDTDTQTINAPIVLGASQQWFESFGPLTFGGQTINLNANTLTLQFGFPTTINNAISGAGGTIIKSGTGVLTLNGATTHTNATQIAAGTLRLGGNNILGDSVLVSLTGGTAVLDVNGFTDTITGPISSSANAVLQLPGSSSLTHSNSADLTFSGIFTGAPAAIFTKAGTGTYTLTGVHTFPGTYRISQGEIETTINERLADTADLTVQGGQFRMTGAITETVDIVTLTGGAFAGGQGTLIGSAYNVESGTVNLQLGGTATLTKSTSANVSLNTTNTYTGGTVINAGTLTLLVGSSLADTGAVTANTGGTLVLSSTHSETIGALSGAGGVNLQSSVLIVGSGDATSTFSGVISGAGNLGKTGTGTLTLSGANTWDGNMAIFGGELRLGNNDVLSDVSSVGPNSGTTFNLNGFSDRIRDLNGQGAMLLGTGTLTVAPLAGSFYSGIMSGTGNLTVNGALPLTLTGANTYTGTTTVSSGTLLIGASERLADASDLTVSGGTFDLQSFNETVDVVTLSSGSIIGTGTLAGATANLDSGTVSAALGGAMGIIKNTSGTVVLSSTNTYTGTTSINAGTLALGRSNVLPNTTTVNVNPTGTFNLAGFSDTIAALNGSGAVNVSGDFLTVGFGGAGSSFSGIISGVNSGGLIKIGSDLLTLSGANTYTGTTTVSTGTLQIGASERLADASDLIVAGGTFDLQSFNETLDVVTLSSGAIIGTGTLLANVFNVQTGTISANVGGPAALTKTTAGAVTLSGTNAYTGGTFLNGGVLEAASQNGLPSGGSLTIDGGTLRTTATTTINGAVTFGAGGATIDTVGRATLSGQISGSGGLTKTGLGTLVINTVSPQLAGLTVNSGDLELPVGGTLIVAGGLTVGSEGLLTLDGGLISANPFANGGEIELLAGARLNGPITNSGVIAGEGRVSGALTNNPTGEVLVTGGESLQFASTASSSNAGVLDVLDAELEFDGELTNLASTGLIFARDALLRFNGGLINAGSVALSFGITDIFGDIENQNGASIVISGGSDATFVDDVVNDGMIRVSQGSAAVFFGAVSGGGSFPGTGTVFLEGDLRPGASPARIEFGGDLVLGSGASLAIEIGGTTPGDEYDQIVVAGEASLDGTLRVLLIDGFVPVVDQRFEIISYGSKTGAFAVVELPSVEGLCIDLVIKETSITVVVESATAFGDANGDCNVDLSDFRSLSECLNGPNGGPNAPGCGIFDFGADDDVDLRDVAYFQTAFTGR